MSAAFSPLPLSKLWPGPDALPPFSVLNSLFQDTFSNLSLLHRGCSLSWEQRKACLCPSIPSATQ